jgi:hypothetical protein
MRRPIAILAALLTMSTATAFAMGHGRRIPPMFTHDTTTLALLYTTASNHLWSEMLRPVGTAAPTAPTRFQMPWERRSSAVRKLNGRALARVPAPRQYRGPRTKAALLRAHDAGTTTIQMIAMGRFSSTDCTLYPYVYTLEYSTTTSALVQENSTVASPTVAQNNGLPTSQQIC